MLYSVLQYSEFNEAFFVLKTHTFYDARKNVILRKFIINCGPPMLIFTKRYSMHVTSTIFYQNRKINVRSVDRISLTPLNKVSVSLRLLSRNSESFCKTVTDTCTKFDRNWAKLHKIQTKANLNCEIRNCFYNTDGYKMNNSSKVFSANILFQISSKSVGKYEMYF